MLMGQAQKAQASEPITTTPDPIKEVHDELALKLQKIKSLLENGLIDESDYKAKQAEILSTF
mgnify:CR=1 FL=1